MVNAIDPPHFVVPANAGTLNPWRSLIAAGICPSAKKRRHSVWVPAFAGTTAVIGRLSWNFP
jgi:hypothetical protein